MDEKIERLMAEAASIDADGQDSAPGAETPESPDATGQVMVANPVDSLAALLSMLPIAAGFMGYARTAARWGPDTCRGVAERLLPVMIKYPWGQRVISFIQSGAGVEEMALVLYLLPLVTSTMQDARMDAQDIAARNAKPVEKEPGPAPVVLDPVPE